MKNTPVSRLRNIKSALTHSEGPPEASQRGNVSEYPATHMAKADATTS